ncbi:MAG: hypothetical protein R3264_14430 [Anaerolineae bacterium]|nr:hypothetical protein [Anaerolineae bacterium]
MRLIAILVMAVSMPAAAQYMGQYHSDPAKNTAPTSRYGNYELRDSSGNYRGQLNSNRYDRNSVSNPHGRYGSKYSPDSVNNRYSPSGSRYGADSPNNPHGSGLGVYR